MLSHVAPVPRPKYLGFGRACTVAIGTTKRIPSIEFDGKQDLRTKVMIALFGLFAEVERDLISERTKEGLAAAKAKGKLLGRPKGALGTSRLDGKEQDIRALLGKEVSKASIAKILNVSRSALYHFIETRKIAPG